MTIPKSLTATIHVRFHCDDVKSGPPRQGEIELLDRLMNHAADLDPALQDLLVKFADYINKLRSEDPKSQTEP